MTGFLIRTAIVALGLWLASQIVPGMHIEGTGTLIAAAILLGIVNAVVRPIFVLLTLPITLLTLGLFLLVVNASMLGLVAWLLSDFSLVGLVPALLGSIVVSLTGWIASRYVGSSGAVEVVVVEERRD